MLTLSGKPSDTYHYFVKGETESKIVVKDAYGNLYETYSFANSSIEKPLNKAFRQPLKETRPQLEVAFEKEGSYFVGAYVTNKDKFLPPIEFAGDSSLEKVSPMIAGVVVHVLKDEAGAEATIEGFTFENLRRPRFEQRVKRDLSAKSKLLQAQIDLNREVVALEEIALEFVSKSKDKAIIEKLNKQTEKTLLKAKDILGLFSNNLFSSKELTGSELKAKAEQIVTTLQSLPKTIQALSKSSQVSTKATLVPLTKALSTVKAITRELSNEAQSTQLTALTTTSKTPPSTFTKLPTTKTPPTTKKSSPTSSTLPLITVTTTPVSTTPTTTFSESQRCGNGIVEAGEECDSGRKDNEKTCEGTLGERVICEKDEDCPQVLGVHLTCIDGKNDGCSSNCKRDSCGDGILQTGIGEECEYQMKCQGGENDSRICFGNNDCPGGSCVISGPTEGCDSSCKISMCGDGRVQAGEDCDPGRACKTGQYGADCSLDDPRLGLNSRVACSSADILLSSVCCDENQGAYQCSMNSTTECTRECTKSYCGDDIINPVTEQCEPESNNNCDSNCYNICGNGYKDEQEQCDPGSVCVSGDNKGEDCSHNPRHCGDALFCRPQETLSCTRFCKRNNECGNGVLDSDLKEECDPGMRCSYHGNICTIENNGSECGPVEECKRVATDTCDSDCKRKSILCTELGESPAEGAKCCEGLHLIDGVCKRWDSDPVCNKNDATVGEVGETIVIGVSGLSAWTVNRAYQEAETMALRNFTDAKTKLTNECTSDLGDYAMFVPNARPYIEPRDPEKACTRDGLAWNCRVSIKFKFRCCIDSFKEPPPPTRTDCAGKPFGSAYPDSCGDCNGDGTSCVCSMEETLIGGRGEIEVLGDTSELKDIYGDPRLFTDKNEAALAAAESAEAKALTKRELLDEQCKAQGGVRLVSTKDILEPKLADNACINEIDEKGRTKWNCKVTAKFGFQCCGAKTSGQTLDCSGTPNGTKEMDECGVCDGDGTKCLCPEGYTEYGERQSVERSGSGYDKDLLKAYNSAVSDLSRNYSRDFSAVRTECGKRGSFAGYGVSAPFAQVVHGKGVIRPQNPLEACKKKQSALDDYWECEVFQTDIAQCCEKPGENATSVPSSSTTLPSIPSTTESSSTTIFDSSTTSTSVSTVSTVPPTNPPKPSCGDGAIDLGEECDDGNSRDGDGCSKACLKEFCGDGEVQYGLKENCDNGRRCFFGLLVPLEGTCRTDADCNLDPNRPGKCQWDQDANTECASDCKLQNLCGNGVVDEPVEECEPEKECITRDDKGYTVRIDCSEDKPEWELSWLRPSTLDCSKEEDRAKTKCCLDERDAFGRITKWEYTCRRISSEECNFNCTKPKCGDGFIQSKVEQCDPPSKTTDSEAPYCNDECKYSCGNAKLEANLGEECDAGSYCTNLDMKNQECGEDPTICGDVADCKPRQTVECNNCKKYLCGNGKEEAGEECDPGARCVSTISTAFSPDAKECSGQSDCFSHESCRVLNTGECDSQCKKTTGEGETVPKGSYCATGLVPVDGVCRKAPEAPSCEKGYREVDAKSNEYGSNEAGAPEITQEDLYKTVLEQVKETRKEIVQREKESCESPDGVKDENRTFLEGPELYSPMGLSCLLKTMFDYSKVWECDVRTTVKTKCCEKEKAPASTTLQSSSTTTPTTIQTPIPTDSESTTTIASSTTTTTQAQQHSGCCPGTCPDGQYCAAGTLMMGSCYLDGECQPDLTTTTLAQDETTTTTLITETTTLESTTTTLPHAPVCGDGVKEGDEECDDGKHCSHSGASCVVDDDCPNMPISDAKQSCKPKSEDGCSAECKDEKCGDGVLQKILGEECELESICVGGTSDGQTCKSSSDCPGAYAFCKRDFDKNCDKETCKTKFCGDKKVSEGEICDGGRTCAIIENGVEVERIDCSGDNPLFQSQPQLACAPGRDDNSPCCRSESNRYSCEVQNNPDCTKDCTQTTCGDGILEPITEQCDPSKNTISTYCTDSCSLLCGDGVVQDREECDLGSVCVGGINAGADCSEDYKVCKDARLCKARSDDYCTGCQLVTCGDGEVDPKKGEFCDNGKRCGDVSGKVCTGEAENFCGDGVRCITFDSTYCGRDCRNARDLCSDVGSPEGDFGCCQGLLSINGVCQPPNELSCREGDTVTMKGSFIEEGKSAILSEGDPNSAIVLSYNAAIVEANANALRKIEQIRAECETTLDRTAQFSPSIDFYFSPKDIFQACDDKNTKHCQVQTEVKYLCCESLTSTPKKDCKGKIGGFAKIDSCGVCNGDSSSCLCPIGQNGPLKNEMLYVVKTATVANDADMASEIEKTRRKAILEINKKRVTLLEDWASECSGQIVANPESLIPIIVDDICFESPEAEGTKIECKIESFVSASCCSEDTYTDCRGELNGKAEVDVCGICDGNNESCICSEGYSRDGDVSRHPINGSAYHPDKLLAFDEAKKDAQAKFEQLEKTLAPNCAGKPNLTLSTPTPYTATAACRLQQNESRNYWYCSVQAEAAYQCCIKSEASTTVPDETSTTTSEEETSTTVGQTSITTDSESTTTVVSSTTTSTQVQQSSGCCPGTGLNQKSARRRLA